MKRFAFILSAIGLIFSGMPTVAAANHAMDSDSYSYYRPAVCGPYFCDGPVRRVVRGAARIVGRTAIGAARIVRGVAIGAARVVRRAAFGVGRVVAGTGRFLFGRRRAF